MVVGSTDDGEFEGRNAGHIKDQLENGAPLAYVLCPVASKQRGRWMGRGLMNRQDEGGVTCTLWVLASALYLPISSAGSEFTCINPYLNICLPVGERGMNAAGADILDHRLC